jgi:hypothetical protein
MHRKPISKGQRFADLHADVLPWAIKWRSQEDPYLNHTARFGSPLAKRIACFILQITEHVDTEQGN